MNGASSEQGIAAGLTAPRNPVKQVTGMGLRFVGSCVAVML